MMTSAATKTDPGPSAPATIECQLCPKRCLIGPGQRGECRIRVNIDGALRAVTYGYPSAVHIDPIEKKPLNHFLPGARVLSIATAGCNLHCRNCQNWELSQADPEELDTTPLPPAELIDLAELRGCPAVAYTYSEPIVYFEYALDSARRARRRGLRNVLVTAGYANAAPMRELFATMDAANVDLKFFDDRLYREVCDASLSPVLAFIVLAREMGVWVELTNLVIPTLNDDEGMVRRMSAWIVAKLGAETPLHLSRFTPRHKLRNLPPTPASTLVRLREVARGEGLDYVYVGNVYVEGGEDTLCPHDGTVVVRRRGFRVLENRLDAAGRCPSCRRPIAGVWGER